MYVPNIKRQINLLKNFFLRRAPFLIWSKVYNIETAISDLIGGITVGLTLIPQVIAYASLAGLEPQYGLYSSLWGGIIYVFIGTVPEVTIAPTAILSMLTQSYIIDISYDRVTAAVLLCFLSGGIELLCGILHLGILTNFVSSPVISAFTSAAAITISSSQVKGLIGIKFEKGHNFFGLWKNIIVHIKECRLWDTVLGLSCCVVLFLMRILGKYGAPLLQDAGEKSYLIRKKLIWLLSLSKNALVVVICSVLAYILGRVDLEPFSLTGEIPTGWPNVSLPAFTLKQNNKTLTFIDMTSEIGAGIFFIPFIDMLALVGIAKAFGQGKILNASQEMIALGICNIVSSFFSSFPISASFSRAAVARASGVKTPLAGVYTATMVFLAFTLLTPYFPYIPTASLAAVIISSVIFMIQARIIFRIWKINKLDLLPFLATFISCLTFGLQFGILIGILVDVIKVLLILSKPKVRIDDNINLDMKYVTVAPILSVNYFSADNVRAKILNEIELRGHNLPHVVIDCNRIEEIDYTTTLGIKEMVNDLNNYGKQVFFVNVNEKLYGILNIILRDTSKIFSTYEEIHTYIKDKEKVTSG